MILLLQPWISACIIRRRGGRRIKCSPSVLLSGRSRKKKTFYLHKDQKWYHNILIFQTCFQVSLSTSQPGIVWKLRNFRNKCYWYQWIVWYNNIINNIKPTPVSLQSSNLRKWRPIYLLAMIVNIPSSVKSLHTMLLYDIMQVGVYQISRPICWCCYIDFL